MIEPCLHAWDEIACIYRAEIDPRDPVAHTAFRLLGCTRCRTVDAFPAGNARLATEGYIDRLRGELATSGWRLPPGIAWYGQPELRG